MTDPETGHLAPTESHERENPGIEDLNVSFSAYSDAGESSVTIENCSKFPNFESKETAFFEAVKEGDRIVIIGA